MSAFRAYRTKDGEHGSELIISFAAFELDGRITDSQPDALTFRIGCTENDVLHSAARSRLYQKSIANTYFIMQPVWQLPKNGPHSTSRHVNFAPFPDNLTTPFMQSRRLLSSPQSTAALESVRTFCRLSHLLHESRRRVRGK